MRIVNKKGLHDYHILESWEAGIELLGHEVKTIRSGRIELGQSYVKIIGDQLFLVNAHIQPYQNAQIKDYNPYRSRRLLLHRKQIQSLIGQTSASGITLIPVAIYEAHNLIKLQIALAKSKKKFDKRRIIKERDHNRRIQQELRGKE